MEAKAKENIEALKDKGNMFFKVGKFSEAIDTYIEALNKILKIKELKDDELIPIIYSNISNTFLKIDNYKEALNNANLALEAAHKINYINRKITYRKVQALIGLKDYKQASLVVDAELPKITEKSFKIEFESLQQYIKDLISNPDGIGKFNWDAQKESSIIDKIKDFIRPLEVKIGLLLFIYVLFMIYLFY